MKKSLLTLGAFGLALVLAGGARAMTMTDLLEWWQHHCERQTVRPMDPDLSGFVVGGHRRHG